jgi:hypothetical protein
VTTIYKVVTNRNLYIVSRTTNSKEEIIMSEVTQQDKNIFMGIVAIFTLTGIVGGLGGMIIGFIAGLLFGAPIAIIISGIISLIRRNHNGAEV